MQYCKGRRHQRTKGQRARRRARCLRAFTLLEVLIVVAVISLLVAILLPGLGRARQQAAAVVCKSNIRQLALANDLYSRDFGGRYVPGAPNIRTRNLERWHGRRKSIFAPFDGTIGPLSPYLGQDHRIRACPVLAVDRSFDPLGSHFEAGCGGYGYNNAYLGVRGPASAPGGAGPPPSTSGGAERHTLSGAAVHAVAQPAETVMFTDAAFAGESLIEYSFAEPRFHVRRGTRADPSIHFRHAGAAAVAWCDLHVSSEDRTFTWSSGLYTSDPDRLDLGWFGKADDNSLFDLN